MGFEQDDFDEETDILFMTLFDEERNKGQQSGSCLMFLIGMVGISALPILLLVSSVM